MRGRKFHNLKFLLEKSKKKRMKGDGYGILGGYVC